MVVKNRLLEIRLKLGYKNQKEFYQLLDISRSKLSRFENNISQPSIEELFDIAEKLNLDIKDIVYKEDNETK